MTTAEATRSSGGTAPSDGIPLIPATSAAVAAHNHRARGLRPLRVLGTSKNAAAERSVTVLPPSTPAPSVEAERFKRGRE